MQWGDLLAELKRRHIYKIAVAYAVVSWILIQIVTQVFPFFEVPNWAVQLAVLALVLGFPVALTLAWAFELAPSEGITEGEAAPNERRTRQNGRKVTATLVIMAVASAGIMLFRILPRPSGLEQVSSTTAAIPLDRKAIAVLPFANLSDDKENAYFVSGVRDEILTNLAQLSDLTVRSRTSTQKYESHPEDLRVLSRELGVATVLEGRVVQLIGASTRRQLWAQSSRRTVHDMFSVQGEVAQQVAQALQINLAQAQEKRLHVPPTTNVVAHDLFLRAHALGAHSDERSLEKKIALLQRAVKEDPHYAMAWGDLAGAYLTIADAYRAPLAVLEPMRHAALMAVQEDDGAGVGHIWLGAVSMLYDRNFSLARRELERAVALGPNSSDAHRWLGWYRARVEADYEGGRAEVRRARALDPAYTWPIIFESFIALANGDYEPALQLAEQVMEVDPRFFYDVDPVANVYAAMGRWKDAVKRYESLPAGTLTRPNFQLAICYAHTGQTDRARTILADLEELSRERYVDQAHLAAIYAVLGEKDKAFAALDQACTDRSARISTPRFYQWLAPLCNDPRFAAIEYKINHSALLPADDYRR